MRFRILEGKGLSSVTSKMQAHQVREEWSSLVIQQLGRGGLTKWLKLIENG